MMGPIDLKIRKKMGSIKCLVTDILQNILFCVKQRNSYRFGTTWSWINVEQNVEVITIFNRVNHVQSCCYKILGQRTSGWKDNAECVWESIYSLYNSGEIHTISNSLQTLRNCIKWVSPSALSLTSYVIISPEIVNNHWKWTAYC